MTEITPTRKQLQQAERVCLDLKTSGYIFTNPSQAIAVALAAIQLKDAELTTLRARADAMAEALEQIEDNTFVGKAGQIVTNRSKWANYPARLYYVAKEALTAYREQGGKGDE